MEQNPHAHVAKAKVLIDKVRGLSNGVKGNSPQAQWLRDYYEEIARDLESAIALSDGPVKSRAQHWKLRLTELLDEAVERIANPPGAAKPDRKA